MNFKKTLHHAFFGFIAYLSFGFAAIPFLWPDNVPEFYTLIPLPPIAIFLLSMALFLLACGKIITYNHRSVLLQPSGFFWKKEYFKPASFAFCVILACCIVFYLLQDMNILNSPEAGEGITNEEFLQQQSTATMNFYVLFLGAFFLWLLFLKNMITDIRRNWLPLLLKFIKTNVTVFLVFRAFIFLLSLLGALLMGSQSGSVQNSYFLFALDDAQVQSIATGSLVGGGTFFSGITEAASFFVLATMAEEFLSGNAQYRFSDRLRRMFLELDTVKLILMTLLCIVISILSAGEDDSFIANIASSVLLVFWFISLLLFISDTKILPYAIIFASMGFIERLLPIPDVTGILSIVIPVIVVARIVLFSVVALLIANYQINRNAGNLTSSKPGNTTFSHLLWNATFLDLFAFLERISDKGLRAFIKPSSDGSDEADIVGLVAYAKIADNYINNILTKITQSLTITK